MILGRVNGPDTILNIVIVVGYAQFCASFGEGRIGFRNSECGKLCGALSSKRDGT